MKTPISRSSTLTPINHKDPTKLSQTPPPSSLKLKMFKIKDPLAKTRVKKQDFAETQPIIQTQYVSTNLTQNNLTNIYNKTKVQKLKQIQDIESCIEALKSQIWNCRQFRESEKNTRKQFKITPTKRSFTFFDRNKIERELSNQYLLKKGKGKGKEQIEREKEMESINPQHLEEAISNKLSLDRKLEVRTILSNKIRGNLIESIKNDNALEIVPKLVSQEKSKWVEKFPEVKEAIVSKNLVKKRKYLKSVESRSYNPYHSFLAMPKHGRRFILSNFEEKMKNQY